MKKSYVDSNHHHYTTPDMTNHDIDQYDTVSMATRGTGYFVRCEDCHTYKSTNITCHSFTLENRYDGSSVDMYINYNNGDGKIINISMEYEYDTDTFIENVSYDEAIKFIVSYLQKNFVIIIQDKLDENIEFVCSSYNVRYSKSKPMSNESLYQVMYTIHCDDDHEIIFHANCFPNIYEMVINDRLSDNETSMVVETLEDGFIEKVVSVLSDFISYKKPNYIDHGSSVDKYDIVGAVADETKSMIWEHRYGDDDIKRMPYDHFILNTNHDVMMAITLEYLDDNQRDKGEDIRILTFTAHGVHGTYKKKIMNITISDAINESTDFISHVNRWCGGRMM